MKKINNPYLTIINSKNKYNPNDFDSFEYRPIDVKMGDWFKKTGLVETKTLTALQNATLELEAIGGSCVVNSAGRTKFDQLYAKIEKFVGVLKSSKSIKKAVTDTKNLTAKIGYSEHLSALAVDLSINMDNAHLPTKLLQKYPDENMAKLRFMTKRFIMEKNGFILRYPVSDRLEEVTGVAKSEGWHWRYVEPQHSKMIARIRERVNEEVFLEDYVKLLQFDVKASDEDELLDTYVNLFETEILGKNSNLTV